MHYALARWMDQLDGNKSVGIIQHTYHVRFVRNLQNLNSVYLWIELLPYVKHLLIQPFFIGRNNARINNTIMYIQDNTV
jgi:hypothetical protein